LERILSAGIVELERKRAETFERPLKYFAILATFRAGSDSNPRVAEVSMVVITSIFVAEITDRLRPSNTGSIEWDLTLEKREKVLGESGRELIGMYEGKNRLEPME